MSHGLTEQAVNAVQKVFEKYEEIERVILFGSRALGTYNNASDIDLALAGSKIDLSLLFKIELDLDYLLLPYKIDLILYHQIENYALLRHIQTKGVVFYKKERKEK